MRLALEERRELVELLRGRRRPARPAPDARALVLRPGLERIAAVHAAGERRNSSCVACSSRVAIASSRSTGIVMPFVEPQLLLELLAAQAERRARAAARRRSRGTAMYAPIACDASVCASARSPSRCRSSTLDERARQVVVDELQRAAHRLDADLDEDAGRILDVVARRLDEPRRLAQLREHAAGALGGRRVGEERLRRRGSTPAMSA